MITISSCSVASWLQIWCQFFQAKGGRTMSSLLCNPRIQLDDNLIQMQQGQ
ncbi:hypothetical protein E2320_020586 [Naja naja]|nr:hypothetical protein E2320_020586 [Naja naja]